MDSFGALWVPVGDASPSSSPWIRHCQRIFDLFEQNLEIAGKTRLLCRLSGPHIFLFNRMINATKN